MTKFSYRYISASAAACISLCLCLAGVVRAEVKVIEIESTYLLGDQDSRIEARRAALQEAKRKALEQAGTYVESLTVIRNFQLSKDEVKAYTAGIVETEIVAEQMRGTAERPEIYLKAVCRIDSDALARQIEQYRENEDLQEQLAATFKENEQLRQERDRLMSKLASTKDRAYVAQARKKLDEILTKEETRDEVVRVWNLLGFGIHDPGLANRELKDADLERARTSLERAAAVDPKNQRAQCLLAAVYERSGRPKDAEATLRKALHDHPSSPAPHFRLGLLLRGQSRHAEALREFHFVERVRPRNLPVVYYSGMSFKDLNKCGKAVQYLNRFLKDKRADVYPELQKSALAAIEACGGDRPGRQKRVRQR